MWAHFLGTSILAFGLLIPEMRRLFAKYGVIFAAVVGTCAVLLVSGWLLALFRVALGPTGTFSTLRSCQLVLTFLVPLSVFLYARGRYSLTPSLFPAAIAFVTVTVVFISVEFSYAY